MIWMLLAASEPTHLICTLGAGATAERVEIVADQTGGKATIMQASANRTVTLPAVFSPSELRIADRELTWIVDRTSLAFHQVVQFGDYRNEHDGRCEVKPVPAKRAF